jgi:hypothetical protein
MEMNQENNYSKKMFSAIGLGAILLMAFVLVQPVQVSAQGTLSNQDVIEMIEEQVGDLTPEEEEMINEQLDNMRNMGSGGTGATGVTSEAVSSFNGCVSELINPFLKFIGFNLQPEDAISQVTIRNGNIAKTIHAEKEIFHCFTEQGGVPLVVEMTVFAEIFENMNTMEVIRKQVEVVTCTKLLDTAQVIGCESQSVDTDFVPLRNCEDQAILVIIADVDEGQIIPFIKIPLEVLPNHPQEMNVVNKGKIVKAIESQKEIFLCDLDRPSSFEDLINGSTNDVVIPIGEGVLIFPVNEKKVETVIFTEIWEDLNLLPNDPVVKKNFESLRCVVTLIVDGDGDGEVDPWNREDRLVNVESCQFSSH